MPKAKGHYIIIIDQQKVSEFRSLPEAVLVIIIVVLSRFAFPSVFVVYKTIDLIVMG